MSSEPDSTHLQALLEEGPKMPLDELLEGGRQVYECRLKWEHGKGFVPAADPPWERLSVEEKAGYARAFWGAS